MFSRMSLLFLALCNPVVAILPRHNCEGKIGAPGIFDYGLPSRV